MLECAQVIDLGGVATRVFHRGSGKAILLISGGHFGDFYSGYHWSLNFPDLAERFSVYSVDKLGQGETANPPGDEEYTMGRVIDHLKAVLDWIPEREVTVVGHSRGALPAARMAMECRGRVSGLVLVASNTLAPPSFAVPRGFYERFAMKPDQEVDFEAVAAEVRANSYSLDHLTDDFAAEMMRLGRLSKMRDAQARMRVLRESVFMPSVRTEKFTTLDAIREGHLNAPCLVIWGARDPSAPLTVGAELFEQIGMGSRSTVEMHVFSDAAHYVYRERAREFNRLVSDFVSSI